MAPLPDYSTLYERVRGIETVYARLRAQPNAVPDTSNLTLSAGQLWSSQPGNKDYLVLYLHSLLLAGLEHAASTRLPLWDMAEHNFDVPAGVLHCEAMVSRRAQSLLGLLRLNRAIARFNANECGKEANPLFAEAAEILQATELRGWQATANLYIALSTPPEQHRLLQLPTIATRITERPDGDLLLALLRFRYKRIGTGRMPRRGWQRLNPLPQPPIRLDPWRDMFRFQEGFLTI